jgi:hypothetical protein
VVATALTPFEPLVRQLLKDHPDLPVGGDRGAGRVDGVDHVVS